MDRIMRSNPYRIPFGDLRVGDIARKNVKWCLDSNWISEGPLVEELEESFAKTFGFKHAIATSSGTDAGTVVWSAIREVTNTPWGEGEVLTPACGFAATANCLLAAGIIPSFTDIELATLNMGSDTYTRSSPLSHTFETKAIGVQFVATMGKPSPLDEVERMATQLGRYLVIDACEAHGATLHQRDISTYGNAATYSFYTAHLVVGGEGGMIGTNDDTIAELCRSIRSHGRRGGEKFFAFDRVGFNSKMTDLEAAVGLEGLERFRANFRKRRGVRNDLIKALKPFENKMILYRDQQGETIAPHGFAVVLREGKPAVPLMKHLGAEGIEVKTLFGSLPTQHDAFKFLGYRPGEFPNAEYVGNCGLHFGCTEFMTDDDVEHIAKAFEDYFKEGGGSPIR